MMDLHWNYQKRNRTLKKPGRLIVPFLLLMLVLLTLSSCRSTKGDALDQVRARQALRWGGDKEGGAPYVFANPDNPDQLIGFEIDLMAGLSQRLGVKSEFLQNQWDKLPTQLDSGGLDCITNGYELRKDRLQGMICTIPYYINKLQLLANRDNGALQSWDDLRRKPGEKKKRVGVLSDTTAQRYLEENFADDVQIEKYDGTTQALDHVSSKVLDATLTDWMAARHYQNDFPKLRFIGEPVERNYFVIYLRPGDERLRDELNAGIRDMLARGQIRQIYERYHIWSDLQNELTTEQVQSEPERMKGTEVQSSAWAVVRRNIPSLLESAWMTIKLSGISFPLAILIGLVVALGRVYGPAILRWPLGWYVEIIRGTPLMLQLFVLFYVAPRVVALPSGIVGTWAIIAAVSGLAINYSAYEAEIYRAGLLAIPAGQMEAALALGMTRRQAIWNVIVPQAVRIVIPPVTNDFIALFKDTAVCAAITIVELSKQYSILAQNNTRAGLEFAAVTAILYLMMSYPMSLLARRLEKRVPPINA
ncbi:MAG TPA: ABC transporter substrate-binding protein/permease [Gemmataceae bacterium]|jgi:polar amino acid transport system substrate-binding protein|nr:ABC transporter substrate-binding protein/permease [Gemmataceae bacterium]